MTDLTALEAQKKTLTDTIATLSGDLDRHALSRSLPSTTTTRLSALRRQLAMVNMKLKQGRKTAV